MLEGQSWCCTLEPTHYIQIYSHSLPVKEQNMNMMWTAYVPVISRIVRLKSTTSSVPFPVWAAEPENRGDRFDTMLHKHWVYAKHQANAVKHDCFKNIKLERIVHSIYMSVLCDIIIYISLYRMSSQNHVGREKSWLLRPVKQPVCLFSHENQAMMIFLLRWTLHSAPLNQANGISLSNLSSFSASAQWQSWDLCVLVCI